MRTQVAIIGAGPAGLVLAHLLYNAGIESVILENRSRDYIEARLRAGVLEQGTVELLRQNGVGVRLDREGLRHDGIYLQWPGTRQHLDFLELCGRSVWIYGQTEVVKDLVAARLGAGQPMYFEVSDSAVHDIDTDRPAVTFLDVDGNAQRIQCDLIAGCDGFHGISRSAIPAAASRSWERDYPYGWLGILAQAPPSTDELIYAWHSNGFAMHSMRSPSISRLYFQVSLDETLQDWSDDRIWTELTTRLAHEGWELTTGPVLDKSITPMRSFVSAPMRYGRLFLAGDAAHIVPPTGAKGLNLAVADAKLLADAIIASYGFRGVSPLDAYQETALRRVWRCTHFSWWMTSMLHTEGSDPFARELQLAQLRYLSTSRAAAQSLAENYTGLPFGW
ncbi:MAG: 4-hydroxybenzoate 3-monooxygenase [Geodermatophilaceae bacterium]|nr:4-hydroxybenzoate 3-monooxygenase [Geodermatophilaceae bacterium]